MTHEITSRPDLADRIADALIAARDARREQGFAFYREHMAEIIRLMLSRESKS